MSTSSKNNQPSALKSTPAEVQSLPQDAFKNGVPKKASKKRGRPTKYTPEIVALICEGVRKGMPLKYAAQRAGISSDTFCHWRNTYPEFSEAIKRAEAEGMYVNLERIDQAANKGDTASAKWILEHRYPEDFARNRFEMRHEVEGQIKHELLISPAVLEHIAKSREQYEQGGNHV